MLLANIAVAQPSIPGLKGRASLIAPEFDFELREAAATPAGDVWAVVVARPRGKPTGVESFVLASFRVGGEVTRTDLQLPGVELAAPTGARRRSPRRVVEDIESLGDGRVVLALAAGTNPASIVIKRAGVTELDAPQPLPFAPGTDIHELVALADGRLLAVGTSGTRPIVAEITAEGKTVWQQQISADPVFVDAARATRDGGVVVLGRRGQSVESQEIWIAKLSPKGALEHSVTYAARGGTVCELSGGGFAVVTHAVGTKGFDLTLRLLGSDLRERSSRPLLSDQLNPAVDIAPVPSGGFVIAGSRDRGLWVGHHDASGTVIWNEHREPQPPDVEMVFNLKLLAQRDTLALAYTAFTTVDREQRQAVRVLTFVVK
jgi:hypothetical protein